MATTTMIPNSKQNYRCFVRNLPIRPGGVSLLTSQNNYYHRTSDVRACESQAYTQLRNTCRSETSFKSHTSTLQRGSPEHHIHDCEVRGIYP